MVFSYCFGKYVPDSTDECTIVKPDGWTFVNGMGSGYCEEFDEEAFKNNNLTKTEFQSTVGRINDLLMAYMPCPGMCCCGYLLALPTLGLSLLLMYCCCVSDAQKRVDSFIDKTNTKVLNKKGMSLHLVRKCHTSWLEFRKSETLRYEQL